jgi:TPP-dependent pyruvate/acetoin dehydrogenase alpha subunit
MTREEGRGKREAGGRGARGRGNGGKNGNGGGARVADHSAPHNGPPSAKPHPTSSRFPLPAPRLIDLYYWMTLTRTLEERLVALYRQTKVVGGLFRSLGQEADAVGSAYALEARDVLSPLVRNLGSMLVKGATPVEILRQYMAKGDSPTRGRELNIHFGDRDRGFIGQISPLGDMIPVMAGVTLTFKMRGEDRVGLVYAGDGATSTGAFHEGINFAAVQRCPLVVVIENNQYAYSTPTSKQTAARQFVDKAIGYGIPGEQADGNDVLAVYDVTKRAVDRARRGEGVSLIELMTYRRKGHAEHDNQSYVPDGEIERWERENDPITRYEVRLQNEFGFSATDISSVDERVRREVDEATELAERSAPPAALDALVGVYADPPAERPLWFREGTGGAVEEHERPESWGTYDRGHV